MPTSPALILHTGKYADDRLVVEAYTLEAGAVSFITRVSHGRAKARIPHTLFQPLALLEITWPEQARTTLHKPQAARPLIVGHSIATQPVKAALALFLAEFLRAVLRHEPPAPPVFHFCAHAVRWLNLVEGRPLGNVHLAILVRLATLLGFRPTPEELSLTCPQQYQAVLPQLLRINLANQHLYLFTRAQRAEFLRQIQLYYSRHYPAFPELKSAEVLTQIFG